MSNNFVQVKLERRQNNHTVHMISFIEAKHKVGARVIDDDGIIWKVTEVFSSSIKSEDEAKRDERDYKRHRKATDI